MDPEEGITGSVDRMNRELVRVVRGVVRDGAQQVAKALTDSARAKGRGRMSNVGKSGVKLAVKVKTQVDGVGAVAVGRANNAGAWAIADAGAGPHTITSKLRKHLTIGADKQVLRVRHPGAAGTGAWTQGLEAAEGELDDTVSTALAEAFEQEF